jgi:hypothetical protein
LPSIVTSIICIEIILQNNPMAMDIMHYMLLWAM